MQDRAYRIRAARKERSLQKRLRIRRRIRPRIAEGPPAR